MKIKQAIVGLFALLASVSASATDGFTLTPSPNRLFVNTTGEVIVTFLSATANYSNDLFLRGNENVILNNQTAETGSSVSLGQFEAGTELSFFIKSVFYGLDKGTFYSGDATVNGDGVLHAAYDVSSKGHVVMGFEDIEFGGDQDFDDIVFSISNVSVAAVPEPSTLGFMLVGLPALFLVKRRKAITRS